MICMEKTEGYSKGRPRLLVRIPVRVQDRLGLERGDDVVFDIDRPGKEVLFMKSPFPERLPRCHRWTKEQDELLRNLYEDGVPLQEIAERFEVTNSCISSHAWLLGLKHANKRVCCLWTSQEDDFLRVSYETGLSERGIAEQMERTRSSVTHRANRLGLEHNGSIPNGSPGSPWTSQQDDLLRSLYAAGVPVVQIAERVGRAYHATGTRASKLGLEHKNGRGKTDVERKNEASGVRAT